MGVMRRGENVDKMWCIRSLWSVFCDFVEPRDLCGCFDWCHK